MGAISDFVAAFIRDYGKYQTIEREVEAVCSNALRPDIEFLWQSRVKAPESLEKKLRDRFRDYENESENVADVKDLVAGRIILARWHDFQHVEEMVKQNFTYRSRTRHPKLPPNAVNFKTRFRGYDGLHFYVKCHGHTDEKSCNPVIEIQVMSAFMWAFSTLQHDIEYKKLHGEPDEDLLRSLDLLKGIANLGEIALQVFDTQCLPVAKSSIHTYGISPDLQATILSVAADVRFDENDKQCLQDLRVTDPRLDKERIEASKDTLLEGCCSWVLEDRAFVDWWTHDDSRLLWIHGDPGKGKTMMMMALISEVANRLNEQPGSNVLAYFFCQDTSKDLKTTVSLLRGLIYLLVDQEKNLVRHIRKWYDGAGKQLFEGPNAMYALRMILSDILKDQSLDKVYLMVDALDECDTKVHEVLDWIIHPNSGLPPKIKWLTTSRNVPTFTERLGRDHQLHTSLELNSEHVARAVARFIDYKVKELAYLKSYPSELQTSVSNSLSEKAEDTFLWGALVSKELSKVRRQRVNSLLEQTPKGLIPLYKRMLDEVLHQEVENDIELCRQILCSVTLAKRPLLLEEIAVFTDISDNKGDVEGLVGQCGSFLTIREETVYFVHQSAKDYLSDAKRKDIFPLGQEHEHANIACLCLRIMSHKLRKDICSLQKPGFRLRDVKQSSISDHIPFYVQYACLYWVDHLQQADSTNQETLTLREDCQVLEFLKNHFLHWLEALILLSRLSEAVLVIKSLGSIEKFQVNTHLSSFVNDARRFILKFRSIIETAPLQVYVSALVFSPESSIVKRQFSYELPNWIERLPNVEEAWPASLLTLESHSWNIAKLIFSPDGQLLASAYQDGTVAIWDTSTGALRGRLEDLEGWLERSEDMVTTMIFTSNSQLLSFGPHNNIIRIWDPITQISQNILEGRVDRAIAFAFSPDGRFLASGSEENTTIELWNPLTWTARGILEGHSDLVKVMAFAPPNGQLLASGSADGTVKLWDTSTAACRNTLEGHSRPIAAVLFSPPDGRLLASVAEDDYTIRLWDTLVGTLKCTLQGHSWDISSILFSPDGQLIVSASVEHTIRFWDSATGASRGLLDGYSTNNMISPSFSPDGRLLAVASGKVVQLYDPATQALRGTLKGHSEDISRIQFSPNGHLLATGSSDKTIRLWNTVKVTSGDEVEGHSEMVTGIAVSPNGHIFASQSDDATIRLWDSLTGTCQHILKGHSSGFTTMAFSPDSQLLASGCYDGSVRLWDVATGMYPFTIMGPTGWVTAVVFSPGGQILASAYGVEAIILLWDLDTKASPAVLKDHAESGYTEVLSFSPDGRTLASANPECHIRLWDVTTYASRGTLQGGQSGPIAMTFSPDNRLLAAAFYQGTVGVWDIRERTLIQQKRIYPIGNYSFNHDGSLIQQKRIYPIGNYSVDHDGSQLLIRGRLVQISFPLNDSAHEQVWSTAPYGVDEEGEWVTYKGCNVLWLPYDRRLGRWCTNGAYAIHENSLVLGSRKGLVTRFQFSTTVAPPGI